jgi:hypothetical protein
MRAALSTLLTLAFISGCGEDESPQAAQTTPAAATATATPAPEATPEAAQLGEPVTVPSTANVFGAGLEEPPAPASGGPGDLPVELALPSGARVVRVTRTSGSVTPLSDGEGSFAKAGAEGSEGAAWKLPAAGGISGLAHKSRRMFLTGVFLSEDPPGGEPPRALSYGSRVPARQSPKLAQTFLMGDGKGRTFRVPKGATRLFLGFADFKTYHAERGTGDYTNNRGELSVVVEAS